MPLLEELESSGNWLFRWRSYLPLVFAVLFFAALGQFHYPFGSHFLDQMWELVCLAVASFGLLIRVMTIGFVPAKTSGRNTKQQVADVLNTSGMYSLVRHPLYLGNFFMALGPVLFLRVWWLLLMYMLAFMLYYERIIFAEEMFLRRKFGPAYLDWASKTPAFFPRFRQWESPQISFSPLLALRREYHGAFAVVVSVFLLETLTDIYQGHGFAVDTMWKYILGGSVVLYGAVRFLHKYTQLLKPPRR